VFFYNLIALILPFPAKKRFHGYTFTGQYCTVSKYRSLLVRNVRGKEVDDAALMPRETSQEPTAELIEQLFIRNGESYIKFFFDN
jgi:hypothetical protein